VTGDVARLEEYLPGDGGSNVTVLTIDAGNAA
jgi:hypothetical protein